MPKPASGVDVRRLAITPTEAFVLSRVDGRATGSQIALATGLAATDVVTILRRLQGLGAVQYDDGPEPTASSLVPSSPRTSGPVIRDAEERPIYDPAELDEPADLEPARKRMILDEFHRLPKASHYELLRVAVTADKKAIKTAYYDVVGRFHPDKFFGKNLGAFKAKLEIIFKRVTEAHDTLTRAASREEYDRYLESQRATRELEDVGAAVMDDIRREIEREARLADQLDRTRTPSSETGATREAPAASAGTGSSGPPGRPSTANLRTPSAETGATSSHPPGTEVVARPAMSAEDRRRVLARKLGASMPPSGRTESSERPVSVGPNAREMAAENLRRRYEAQLARARDERVRRYTTQAEESLAANNLVAAANALRIAVSLAPDDVPLADQLDKVERQAAATLADQYLEQARYDERRGHMAQAAHAYEKVLRGRPSAYVYERAAHCLLEAHDDLKRAGDLAKKAVELSPGETAYRITLARVYAKAGMEASAIGELERARTLDPGDDTVKDWIKRVKRGEI